ncbi:MAG TPA: oligosaccharide flippase family protein [Candidatus Moranbacteria bacterium]|nr:oligosaccharide flippase family protein [Candidatus Moranbacteria bacterium]
MISKIRNGFINILEILHLRIFGHKMSYEMKKFIGHLPWSFLGLFFSSLILFSVNILAGRILGPESYGKYNLVLVVASIMAIPILLGLDITSIKYISNAKNQLDKNKYLSNSFRIAVFSSFTVFVLVATFYLKISEIFGVSIEIVFVALIFSILLSFKNLLDSFIKSFHFFRFQAIVRIVESSVVIFLFFYFFYFLKKNEYEFYLISSISGAAVLCGVYLFRIRKNIIGWDKEKVEEIFHYSKTTIILACILMIMNSMDKIFIGKFLGVHLLGIYSAYFTVSMIFISQVVLMLGNVFFPMISSAENKYAVVKKIDRLGIIFFIPGTLVIATCAFLMLKLYGKEFQLNQWYIIWFSALSFLQIPSDFYRNVISSENRLYAKMKKAFFVIPIIFFSLYYLVLSSNATRNFFNAILIYSIYVLSYLFITRFICRDIISYNNLKQ